jgi:Methyltransferase FkbM domain
MDIEGFEIMAIHGAENLIRRDRPKLVLQCNNEALGRYGFSSKDLLRKVESLG